MSSATQNNSLASTTKESEKELGSMGNSIKKNKKKIAAAIAGLLFLGSAIKINSQKEKEEDRKIGGYEEVTPRELTYEEKQLIEWQEAVVNYFKLDNIENFVKKNPGKDFRFYLKHVEKLDNDPTGERDGDALAGIYIREVSVMRRIQRAIDNGDIKPEDIGLTESQWERKMADVEKRNNEHGIKYYPEFQSNQH